MIRGAVLGSPISHSLSPVLHSAAFEFLGVEGSYEAIEVKSGTLAEFLSSVNDRGGFDYFSLTMPLKEEILKLGIPRDDLVKRIQSANTLYHNHNDHAAEWFATSTDGSGFMQALARSGHLNFDKALILGAGGTARAVAGAIGEITNHVHVMGRTKTREQAIADCVLGAEFSYLSWDNEIDFSFYDLVINTTPAGAADLLAQTVPPKILPLYFDVIYKPWPTVLAQRWMDSGGEVIDGLELLIYQGIDQLDLVLGIGSTRIELADHLRKVLRSH